MKVAATPMDKPWNQKTQILLAITTTVCVAAHLWGHPAWISLVVYSLAGWKFLNLLRGVKLPPKLILHLSVVGAVLLLVSEFNSLVGAEPMGFFLACLAILKLLDTNRYHDGMFLIFTNIFLLCAAALQSQTLEMTIYISLNLLLITVLLFQVNNQENSTPFSALKPAIRILAFSMPIWITLFFVFPRFSTGFFGNRERHETGLMSAEISPGSVANLVLDDAIAFRAKITAQRPMSTEDLYWRGKVLNVTEGLRWTSSRVTPRRGSFTLQPQTVTYEVLYNKPWEDWIFALEWPNEVTLSSRHAGLLRSGEDFYQLAEQRQEELIYSGSSSSISSEQSLTPQQVAIYTQVPEHLSVAVHALAQKLQQEAKPATPDQLAQAVVNWYYREKFQYTLSPGTSSNSLDAFLFQGRKGFCEHFAGTTALLLRMMQVPSRVVIGYQGGEYNPMSGLYIVRNRDAHAWLEYFDASPSTPGHWKRLDPTSTIAPARLYLGGRYLSQSMLEQTGLIRAFRGQFDILIKQGELIWDALQSRWSLFLLGYDLSTQLQFLEKLGLKDLSRRQVIWIGIAASFIASGLFALFLFFGYRRRSRPRDRLAESWNELSQILRKKGLDRKPAEGPLTYLRRLEASWPERHQELRGIVEKFISLRYEREQKPSTRDLNDFRRSIHTFQKSR